MEKDGITGSLTYYDLSDISGIVFRMKKYGASSPTIEANMEVVSASLGYCRVKVTIPTSGKYYSEIEVRESGQTITWIGDIYHVVRGIG
ncbi:MAG: hypothetical protein DRN15_09060 [Thermoprotei archaeon]|nr:MAG: hypothetical protein DRN15_09060 [Thermoprotei archaeon]